MEFSRQEYWSGLPFPSPGDLRDSGIKPRSSALQADALPSELPGKPQRASKILGIPWVIGVSFVIHNEFFSTVLKFALRRLWGAQNNFKMGAGHQRNQPHDETVRMFNSVSKLLLWEDSVSSVQFTLSVVSDSLRPHELQHARPPCPSPAPRVHPNSCASNQWCHPAISSSIIPFSSCPQSLPASRSLPMSQFLAWCGQSIGVSASASVLPMNTQDWSPLGWTGWIFPLAPNPSQHQSIFQWVNSSHEVVKVLEFQL